MKYLIVVAHPDDEILGAGATISELIKQGHEVGVATLCNSADARTNISDTLRDDQKKAFDIVGITKSYGADFPNIKMNIVPHLDLVKFIENCIVDFEADAIITHHPSDTNNDHIQTSYACQAACRISQRKPNIKPLKKVLFMEILSSTEWSFNSNGQKFNPNYFVEIDKDGLDIKLKALSAYKGVMREYPHPRSKEAIECLAAYRWAKSGSNYAEAFECVFYKE